MIDQVLSHTSIEHAWFHESRAEPRQPEGRLVRVGRRARRRHAAQQLAVDLRRRGLALGAAPRPVLPAQLPRLAAGPELPQSGRAARATLDNVRFWLDRGVDGLRLDAINFCFHDAQLRDNPPQARGAARRRAASAPTIRTRSSTTATTTRSRRICAFLEDLRALLDAIRTRRRSARSPPRIRWRRWPNTRSRARLHMGYSFELLTDDSSPRLHPRDGRRPRSAACRESWPCWAISNHDVERVVSRWGGGATPLPHFATQLTALVCSLRGSVCVYQGEELGLAEADVPYEALRDPYGIAFWPNFKGRDGCRTPMPWDASERGGFSTGEPWLPVPAAAPARCRWPRRSATRPRRCMASAACSHGGAASRLLIQRRHRIPRRHGLGARVPPLRRHGRDAGGIQPFAGTPPASRCPASRWSVRIGGHGLPEGRIASATLTLPGHGVAFFQLAAR